MKKSLGINELDPICDQKAWSARLLTGAPILIDGATGTELERRGYDARLPLWSTRALLDAPEAIEAIHSQYLAAGAELLTAATFRTQERVLARARELGQPVTMSGRELCTRAIDLARSASRASGRKIFVCGSAPPLEDCYRPDLVPDDEHLAREHREHALNLAEAGADLILVETMNCQREAVAACSAAAQTGLPFLLSFVSWQAGSILSGESLARAIDACLEHGPSAILVNCLPPSAARACLETLSAAGLPFGVYPNLGPPDPESGRRSEDRSPDEFAVLAREWLTAGARLVGGCCGTTPDHIAAIRTLVSERAR